jgi:hypothetical protein
MGDNRNSRETLRAKPEEKKPLGRKGCRWEDNNKMDLMKRRGEDVTCIYLAQNGDLWWALVSSCYGYP